MEIAAIMAIALANGGVFSILNDSHHLLIFVPNSLTSSFNKYISFPLVQGKPPDWQDFVGIVVLLIINSTISFIEENNAGNAAAALMAGLAPKTKVKIIIYHYMYP